MVNPFKTNFWPRPRDGATAILATAEVEHRAATVVTAMTVWRSRLYYAVARAGGLPRLYWWDGSNAATEIALPAFTGAPTQIEINCMAVYDDQLWIGTSPNGSDGNNIEVWYFDGNAWTDASGLAGWTAAAAPAVAGGGYGVGWLFVFNGLIFAGQDTAAGAILVQQWNGATWTNESAVLAAALGAAGVASDTPTTRMHAPVVSDTVYVGAYDALGGSSDSLVLSRTAAGAWGVAFNFPTALVDVPSHPVRVTAKANNVIYAAQGWRSQVSNNAPVVATDYMKLAQITGTQRVRVVSSGYLAGLTQSAARANASGFGVQVILLAGPGGLDVYDPFNDSLEKMTDFQDDAPYDLVVFLDGVRVSQGSDRLRTSTNQALHSARVGRVD